MTFQKRHRQTQVAFTDKFHQIFKKEIVAILYSPGQNTEAEGVLTNSFQRYPNIKTRQRRYKKTTNKFPHKHRCKIINKILTNKIQQYVQ